MFRGRVAVGDKEIKGRLESGAVGGRKKRKGRRAGGGSEDECLFEGETDAVRLAKRVEVRDVPEQIRKLEEVVGVIMV